MNSHQYALILAGGGGTRLWPKSRNLTPKQLLKFGGKKTMLRNTAERVSNIVDWDHIFVITNIQQYQDVLKELPEVPKEQIIVEPLKRETAMAMAVGALCIQEKDPNAVVLNFASDHVVENLSEFTKVMNAAALMAESGEYLLTIGIPPTFAHTGLGYIHIGEEFTYAGSLPVFSVESFREKPNLATARAFLETGKYFWNANSYTWSCKAIIQAFERYAPKTYAVLQKLKKYIGTDHFSLEMEKAYAQVESISIDYAISEKAQNLLLIPGYFGWNDVGDWKVVYDLGEKDRSGNVVLRDNSRGELVEYNSRGNIAYLNGRLVALVDVEEYVIVDTDEILLVMPKARSQEIKKLVEQLKQEKKEKYL